MCLTYQADRRKIMSEGAAQRNAKRNSTRKYLALTLGILTVILFGSYVILSTKYELTLRKITWYNTVARGISYNVHLFIENQFYLVEVLIRRQRKHILVGRMLRPDTRSSSEHLIGSDPYFR